MSNEKDIFRSIISILGDLGILEHLLLISSWAEYTTVKPLISQVFLPISKVYQIRNFLASVRPLFLLKSEGKRG